MESDGERRDTSMQGNHATSTQSETTSSGAKKKRKKKKKKKHSEAEINVQDAPEDVCIRPSKERNMFSVRVFF